MLSKQEIIEYDTQWKKVITVYFEDFVAFFLPDLYKDIDFDYKPEFLDKELHELLANHLKGKREADQLAKVRLKNGKTEWIFIHIEAQSYHDKLFPFRMFTMYYRIWDKYNVDIVAIAIFTTESKMATQYERQNYGTKLLYRYNSYYVKDQNESDLLASDNIFALVVLASRYAMQTKEKTEAKALSRFHFKINLIKLLLKGGYSKHNVLQLFTFIQKILKLPVKLEKEFNYKVKQLIPMKQEIYPNEEMTQDLKDTAEAIYRGVWGLSDDVDIREHLLQRKIEKLAEQKAEVLAEQKAEVLAEQKAEVLAKQVIEKSNLILIKLLYQEMKCSISEIAQRMDKDEDFVINFLKKHNLSAD